MAQTPDDDQPTELSFPAHWKQPPPSLEYPTDISTGPTAADRIAGIQATNRAYAAALLRELAKDHLGELDHVHLPLPGGDDASVSIVATDEVQAWLYGLAIRVENGDLG